MKEGNYQIDTIRGNGDNLTLNIMVVDAQSREGIILYHALIYSGNELIEGKAGNLNGKIQFKTIYSQKPLRIEILFPGYYPFEFEIKKNGEYSVLVELKRKNFTYLPSQERIYKLIKINKDSLVISHFKKEKSFHILYKLEEN